MQIAIMNYHLFILLFGHIYFYLTYAYVYMYMSMISYKILST